jgi:SAM-dependent methyltransferase
MIDLSGIIWMVLATLVLLLAFLWIAVPLMTGLPWVPTHEKRIRTALRMASMQPGETVYDLGSGDGRVLFIAAREFGARAVGIEISPVHCMITWIHALISGYSRNVQVRCASFYSSSLMDADVVYAYVTPEHGVHLRPYLEKQLRSGARVVTISAEIEGWQPDGIDRDDLVFLYHMPPTPGSVTSYLSKDIPSLQPAQGPDTSDS